MSDPVLSDLLTKRAALEGILSTIDVWLLIFGILVVIGVGGESAFGFWAWRANSKLRSTQGDIEQIREIQITDATKRAAEATLELEKMRSPRMLLHIPELEATLKQFRDTEYTFSSVGQDEESINFLKEIDSLLQRAGWKRVKPSGGPPAINVFGKDVDFSVTVALKSGIAISVDSSQPVATLQALPVEKLPPSVKAAIALNLTLFPDFSPPQEGDHQVDVQSGNSGVVRISVGKKP